MSWSEIEKILMTYNWLVEYYRLGMTVGKKNKVSKGLFCLS